ncbi:MAG: FecR family protein [Polyangiaceae bacterium]
MMRLKELGTTIAAVQDDERRALDATARARQGFIGALRQRPAPRRLHFGWAAAVAAACAAALLGFWLKGASPRALQVTGSSVTVGRPIVAPAHRTIPLNFSDGSRVELGAGTEANVVSLTADGAVLELASGQADATVAHRSTTHWTLRAGPYRIAVTGTRFQLAWSPERDHFELTLKEGSVLVTSDNSSHSAVTMRARERLVIERGEWVLSPSEAASDATTPLPSAEPRATVVEGPARLAPQPSSAALAPTPREPQVGGSEWQRLGKLGKYGAAYEEAQALGIRELMQSASPTALLSLAEICRFSGHANEASDVLNRLRQRFAASNEAAIAAFQLGRLATDGRQSAAWFRTYLKDRPQGALAREASGRLLEALDRAGDSAAAKVAAEKYLEQYPTGPHAAFARRLRSR